LLRPIRLLLAGIALFVVAAGAGVLVASHWGPERTRAVLEMSLGEALDRPVAVQRAQLYFGGGPLGWMRGVLLDAGGIEAGWGEAEGAHGLSVERLQARLDPISLFSGRVEVRSVALDGLRARVVTLEPPPDRVAEGTAEGAADGAEPVVAWLEAVAEAAAEALTANGVNTDVSLSNAELEIRGPAIVEGGAPFVMRLHEVAGEGRLRARGHRAHVTLSGRLDAAGENARIDVDLEREAGGALGLRADLSEVALESAAPALRALLPGAELAGTGEIRIVADRPQPDVWQLAIRADAQDCGGQLPRMGDGRAVPVAIAHVEAGLDVEIDPERVHVSRAFVGAGGTEVSLDAEIARPLRRSSPTVGSFGLDHYDLSRRDDLIAFLPPRQIARLRSALEPLRSGRIEDLRVEGSAPLGEWLVAFDHEVGGLLPDSVTARAQFAGFALRGDADEAVTDLSGEVRWSGDRLELRGVRGRRAGHWMPVLDASLAGVSHLAANAGLPEIPKADDAPLMLGLGPMYDIVVDPNRPPGEMPKALLLALDHVVHPTLVWPLRNLFARANPSADGIRLLLEHAVWGRVPVRAEGIWTMQMTGRRRVERVVLRLEAKPPISGMAPLDRAQPVWARGRWHLEAHNLGAWRVLSSTGAFEAEGEDVRLTSYDLDLGIAGRALGEATVDFSDGEELPYRTRVRLVDAQARGVVDKIGFEPDEATGTVNVQGDLHGELRPGRRVIAGMEGTLEVQARDGAILRHLPAVLAVAKATDTFNPFGSRDEIRYSAIDASLRIERGQVHADELRITGRDLRLLATGQVDALDPEHPIEAVVGIFFFKAIDRVIGVVPLLSDLILGEDDSLMGAYVQLTGPWKSPDSALVPLKTVASGPASFAIEGVPRFVKRAVTAIQSAFTRPPVAAPPPDAASRAGAPPQTDAASRAGTPPQADASSPQAPGEDS
jgi:hypothetical protein